LGTASASLPAPPRRGATAKPIPIPPLFYSSTSAEEQKRVLAAATEYAFNYTKKLPDFHLLASDAALCGSYWKGSVEAAGYDFWSG